MTFQPLGYRFEVISPMTPADSKAAIRKKWKGWFEAKDGPRGWIIGPFICLWRSAFDQYGPMVLARIVSHDHGTRIVGRAGADLNGVAMLMLLGPLLIVLLSTMIVHGPSTPHLILVFAFFVVGIPLTLWIAHKDRRSADPLVRFLRQAVAPMPKSHRSAAADLSSAAVNLITNDGAQRGRVYGEQLQDALSTLGLNEFLVIEFEPQIYMQVRVAADRFELEKREGGPDRHFAAELSKGDTDIPSQYEEALKRLVDRMTDYLLRREPAHDLNWKRIRV